MTDTSERMVAYLEPLRSLNLSPGEHLAWLERFVDEFGASETRTLVEAEIQWLRTLHLIPLELSPRLTQLIERGQNSQPDGGGVGTARRIGWDPLLDSLPAFAPDYPGDRAQPGDVERRDSFVPKGGEALVDHLSRVHKAQLSLIDELLGLERLVDEFGPENAREIVEPMFQRLREQRPQEVHQESARVASLLQRAGVAPHSDSENES